MLILGVYVYIEAECPALAKHWVPTGLYAWISSHLLYADASLHETYASSITKQINHPTTLSALGCDHKYCLREILLITLRRLPSARLTCTRQLSR
jgi:hypothetical protein